MQAQGYLEAIGKAKITPAFNLPAQNVIHTVGPITDGSATDEQCGELASCYLSCLRLADECRLRSIAFCCVSCGEYRFPRDVAARIAVETVRKYLNTGARSLERVVFNVYTNEDHEIYKRLFGIA